MDQIKRPSKKRPEQHRTETDGLKFFENKLPNTREASFVFTRGQNDYGIDGEIQVVINEEHTGEFFKVQIKGTTNPSYSKDGSYISFSLDIASAYFLIIEVKSPTALIVVDTDKQKVFWHPIQTDQAARNALENSLSQDSMTIKIETVNVLEPDNYQAFYDYLKEAQTRLSRKDILQARTNNTLGAGMKFLSELEKSTLDIKGFTPLFRGWDDPVHKGAVFTIGYNGNKAIDYVTSQDYRPELAPKLNITTAFSTKTKEGRMKAKAFKKLLEKGQGTVELSDDNITAFEVKSGDRVISDKAYAGGGVSLKLAPSIEKYRHRILLSNEAEELENTVETWLEQGKVHIESMDGQPVHIATAFALQGGTMANFKIRINRDLLSSASQEKRLMEFFRGLKDMEISVMDQEGFRRRIFGGTLNGNRMVNDESYEFVRALTEIEAITSVAVPYPLPEDLKRSDVTNVFWVHKLLTQGRTVQDVTFSFRLKDKPPVDLREGGAMVMSQSPPEIYLFGKPYVVPSLKQEIKGTITSLEKKAGRYGVRVEKAEISIIKHTTA